MVNLVDYNNFVSTINTKIDRIKDIKNQIVVKHNEIDKLSASKNKMTGEVYKDMRKLKVDALEIIEDYSVELKDYYDVETTDFDNGIRMKFKLSVDETEDVIEYVDDFMNDFNKLYDVIIKLVHHISFKVNYNKTRYDDLRNRLIGKLKDKTLEVLVVKIHLIEL